MDVLDLIQQKTVSVKRKSQSPPKDLNNCMVVNEIAAISIAATAGIQSGDLLISVAGMEAAMVDMTKLIATSEPAEFIFYCKQSSELVQLKTNGIPIGITLSLTGEAILSQAEDGGLSFDDLDLVWERGDWKLLEDASRKFLDPGLLVRIILFFKRQSLMETPASLLLGASLYEQGKRTEGLKLIRKYTRGVRKWLDDAVPRHRSLLSCFRTASRGSGSSARPALQRL